MAIIKLNNNALTSVTTINSLTSLPAGLGSDPDVKVDIARLGLRVFANQNLAKQNSNSASYDVFQDATGITNLTNTFRDQDEYVASGSTTLATSWTAYDVTQHTGGTFSADSDRDLFSTTQPTNVGNLGSAKTLLTSGNNNNESHFIGLNRPNIGWGAGKLWNVILVFENNNGSNCYPFYGISGGQGQTNSSNLPNRTSAASTFTYVISNSNQTSAGVKPATGTNGYHINFNLGYDSAVQGFHEDGTDTLYDASDNSIPTGARIITLLSYDGTAGTMTAQFNANNSSTTVTKDMYYGGTAGSGNLLAQRSTTLPTSGFPYFYFGQHNGNSNSENRFQLWYKEGTTTTNATGSFEGVAITAGSSTSKMGAVITYKDQAGTNALNTDLVLKLSADNGSNYSTATLTALPDFSSGVKCCSVSDLSVTAGTQLKYKIEFANQATGSKECRVTGVSLQY
tara:strand:+ start:11846 stop:13207 length:1362 start_codon:yes stop_codon:yes gene_type:complete